MPANPHAGTMRPTERQRRLRLCSVSRACGISAGAVKVKQKEKSVWQPYMLNGVGTKVGVRTIAHFVVYTFASAYAEGDGIEVSSLAVHGMISSR